MATPLTILTKLTQRIRKGFLWISALSLFVTAITIFMVRSIKAEYGAYAKIFPLSINNKSGSASPTEALRAQFGISDRTDYDKIYNIRELVNSRTVSESIARSKPASGPYHSMAEWLIADYNNNKPFWKKNISWDTHDSNTLYYTGASVLLDNTDVNADVKTGFTTITTHAHESRLTQEMNNKILEELSNFYIRLVTEKPRTDLDKIRVMRDSLQHELNRVERAIAGFIDSNQLSVKTSTQLPQYKLLRMQKEVEELYTTTATSYQNAKFKLLSESPIFQVLDAAGPPYAFTKPSWMKYALISFCCAFALFSLLSCLPVLWPLLLDELNRT